MDVSTDQAPAALMMHQSVGHEEVLPALLDWIPPDAPTNIGGGDGAYDTKACHADIAASAALPSIRPREGARNGAEIDRAVLGRAFNTVVLLKERAVTNQLSDFITTGCWRTSMLFLRGHEPTPVACRPACPPPM